SCSPHLRLRFLFLRPATPDISGLSLHDALPILGGFHFCSDVATQGTVGALDHQPHRPHGFHHVRHQIGGLFGGHVTAVQVGHDHVVVPHDTTDVFWGHGGHTHPGPGEPGTGGVGTGEVVCDHEDLGQDLAPSPDLAIDLSPR